MNSKTLKTQQTNVTEEQISELADSFNLFDKKGDGVISSGELSSVMLSWGHNPTIFELQNMINEVNEDLHSNIDFPEFLRLMASGTKTRESELQELITVEKVFRIMDKDQNGFIGLRELQNVMASLGEVLTEEEVKEMIRQADIDCDGQISFQEFVKFCRLP